MSSIEVQRPAELPRQPLCVIPATRTMFVVGGEVDQAEESAIICPRTDIGYHIPGKLRAPQYLRLVKNAL
jgi:hypothetical protein